MRIVKNNMHRVKLLKQCVSEGYLIINLCILFYALYIFPFSNLLKFKVIIYRDLKR